MTSSTSQDELQGIPSVEALEGVHAFPGDYMIKVFGNNDPDFIARIKGAVQGLLDSNEYVHVSERPSSKGNHIALTLRLFVQSAQKVRLLYLELKQQDGIKMVI